MYTGPPLTTIRKVQKNLLVTAERFVNLSLVFSVTTVWPQNLTRVTFSVYKFIQCTFGHDW